MKKVIAILLCAALLLSLSGCDFKTFVKDFLNDVENSITDDTSWQDHVFYTLDQSMVDHFYDCLAEAEDLSINGTDYEVIEDSVDALDEAYMTLIYQNQVSYILYCTDQSDEELSQQYLDSMDICTEADAAYNAMARRVYLSDTPFRDQLFEDWTPEEIDCMLKHNDEITRLEKRNAELTLEYRALDQATIEDSMIPLYNEMVSNNNRIAQIYGYDNYYEYAYEMVYQRDYDVMQLQSMREYVARYIPNIYTQSLADFYGNRDALSMQDQNLMNQIISEDYDRLDINYVERYIRDLGESSKEGMLDMFASKRVIFTHSSDAYQGAFTTWIDEDPFCYYGPGYMESETVVHELGHYYGSLYSEPFALPMDLCETQSQGNEWLFIRYLKEELNPELYDVLVDYKMLSDCGNILVFVMVDAFEEKVYTHEDAGNLTRAEYEALMAEVAEPFGGIDYVSQNISNVQYYWKMVVLESPVYYISYAVSLVASINLYTVAEENEELAREKYRVLIEETDDEKGFLWHIENAGLAGPFEETFYLDLAERYAN